MKTGLVLEGGGMRGMFTAGVLDVMMEEGLTFSVCAGVSAGACFGVNLKSHQPGRALRYNLRFCRDKRYCSFRSLFKTGDLFGADFCYREIPTSLDPFDYETYKRDPMTFVAVCTDVETGEAVYRDLMTADGEDMDWLRASASLPLVSKPVQIGGRLYLDGGVADSIPLAYMESRGCERIVAVLTREETYEKKPSGTMLNRLFLRRYPALLRALNARPAMYNRQVAYVKEREQTGGVFVIRPDAPLDVGRVEHDPARLQGAYDVGRETALRLLPALKAYLGGT